MRKVLLAMIVIALCKVSAQDSVVVTDGFARVDGLSSRKVVATAAVGGILLGSLVDSYYAWWKNANNPFTFHAEGWFSDGSLGIDKAGHLFTSYFYFRTFRNIMLWGGYEPSKALWWAAGMSAFFALSIEIGDGLSEYAFDYQDLVFNIAGVGYGMAQTKHPFLKNFNLKFSYVPSDGYRFPPHFTEHYDDHTYWLSCNLHEVLPSPLRNVWPDWLAVAVGYSVDDRQSKREAVIGLDVNLEVFTVQNEDLLLLQKTVNMFHITGPAVKFTQTKPPRYYLF